MTTARIHRRPFVSAAVIGLLCVPVLAKDDNRQEQLRRLSEQRGDPRCASEGPGFFYEPGTGTCLRIGGAVSVETGRGNTNNLLRR